MLYDLYYNKILYQYFMKFKSKHFYPITKSWFEWGLIFFLYQIYPIFLISFQTNHLMKFIILFQKAALHIAANNENLDIVRLLLSDPKIDINLTTIYKYLF